MYTESSQVKKRLKNITISATFGALLFGYDTGVINGALPFMGSPDQLNLTAVTEGMVTSSLLLGAALGAVFGGRLADNFGRRKTILNLSLLFFFASIGCALSPTASVMIFFRFLLGLAVGAASVNVPTFLSEVSPAERRGKLVTINELMIVTGQLLAFTINAILGNVFADVQSIWRWMLAVAALPAVFLFFSMLRVPESPRWLVVKGKEDTALNVLRQIRDGEERPQRELNEIKQAISVETNLQKASFKDLNTPWFRRIVLIGIGIGICQQVTGVNSIMYYGTQILQDAGFATDAALVANIGNGVISVLATFFGIWLLGKINRRTMFIIGQVGIICALLAIGITSNLLEGTAILPYVTLSLTITFLFFQQGFVSPVTWLLLAEIFPIRLRGFGMGVSTFCLWMANFAVGMSFPSLLAGLGLSATFFMFAGINVIAIGFVYKFCPETRGRTLEQLESEFRNHYKDKDIKAAL